MLLINQIVIFLLSPLNLIGVLLLLALIIWFVGFREGARRMLIVASGLFLLIGFTPVSEITLASLEDRITPAQVQEGDIEGAIVLGGSAGRGEVAKRWDAYLVNESAERLIAAAALRRRNPGWTMIVSGGGDADDPDRYSEETMTKRLFADLGIDGDSFIYEGRSFNTYENARFTRLLDYDWQKPWLLVTSAFHMPRALASFRAQGITVLPYPVDYQAPEPRFWHKRHTVFERFYWMRLAVKEWAGLFAYWMLGRTVALYPAV